MNVRLFPSRASLLWREAGLIEDLQPVLAAMNAAYAAGRVDAAAMHRRWQDQLVAEIEAVRRDLRDVRRHVCLTGWEDRQTGEISFCGVVEPRWAILVTGPVCVLPSGWKALPGLLDASGPAATPTSVSEEAEPAGQGRKGLYVPVTRKVSSRTRKIGASA